MEAVVAAFLGALISGAISLFSQLFTIHRLHQENLRQERKEHLSTLLSELMSYREKTVEKKLKEFFVGDKERAEWGQQIRLALLSSQEDYLINLSKEVPLDAARNTADICIDLISRSIEYIAETITELSK